MYIVCYLTILQPVLQMTFHYSVEGEYLALLSNGDHATLPSEYDMLACVFTRETCVKLTEHCIPQKLYWCLYTLFVNDAEWIKMNCNCEIKLQTHSVAFNLNRNSWAISALPTENLQILCLQKTPHINVKTPFQLVFLPNTFEAYSRIIYILSLYSWQIMTQHWCFIN